MSFASPFKLGRPRKELSFVKGSVSEDPSTIRYRYGPVRRRISTVAGERFQRIFRRLQKNYRLTLESIDEVFLERIQSLEHIADEPLSLIWSGGQLVISERYETTGTLTLTLDSSPPTLLGRAYKLAGGLDTDIINIDGVFTTYDALGAQGGTDFFAGGGTYDATNRIINLGTSPGAAGTEVFMNWNYTGSLVFMDDIQPRHRGGDVNSGENLFDLTISLTGV